MKKSIIALTMIASIASVASGTASACSRIIQDTGDAHGISIARSYDWGGTELKSIARVQVNGTERTSKPVPEYQHAASWQVKYNTVSFEEVETFHNTTGEAINTEGLSASMLYMDDSKYFIKDIKDDGKPAVHLSDIVPFIVESYANVEEAVQAFEDGQWQIAFKTGIGGHQHGFHVSVQDKSGDIALFQLNAGGKMVVHRGDVSTDLRVMANSPLQQDHRAYAAQFDTTQTVGLPSSISSADRNVRGLAATHAANWNDDSIGTEWMNIRGKIKSIFDYGNKVPADMIDPTNGVGYRTWETFVYSLETGGITYYNEGNASQLSLHINDIKTMQTEMCADIFNQAHQTGKISWGACTK